MSDSPAYAGKGGLRGKYKENWVNDPLRNTIINALNAQNMNIADLSRAINAPGSSVVSRWMMGARPSVESLQAIARAGLPPINIHDLRHLHATSGLRLGIPLKVMSDRLGHANIGITADTYTHVQRDLQHDAADRIAAYLLGHENSPPASE